MYVPHINMPGRNMCIKVHQLFFLISYTMKYRKLTTVNELPKVS